MKIILSPAKKMVSDTDSLAPVNVPKHMDQTAEILSFMKNRAGRAVPKMVLEPRR